MEYRQNSWDNNPTDENGEETKEVNHGNTGLPFGLCAKYGIGLPKNATPRDAWNALAGKGIYPPWTEKGAEQWDKDEENTKKSKTEIDTSKKATDIARRLGDKMTKTFDEGYRKNVEEALKNLTDEELAVFDATIDRVATIQSGSGEYRYLARSLTVPTSKALFLDKELGYDFQATTFFHEYGHFVSHCMAEKNPQEGWKTKYDFVSSHEVGKTVATDVLNFFNTCISEQGGKQLADLSRLPKNAIESAKIKLEEITQKNIASLYEPVKPVWGGYSLEEQTALYMRMGYARKEAEERATSFIERQKQRHKEALERYEKRKAEWDATSPEQRTAAKANLNRFGFLTDALGIVTGSRFDPYSLGYYGHNRSYNRDQSNGAEAWAEYFAIKMTKDKKGEEAYKKYMPKTYELFESYYKNLGDMI